MKNILTIAAIFILSSSFAQEGIVLDENYPFKEGIYLTASDFLNNNAITPSQITSIHSQKATKAYNFSKRQRTKGLSWEFFSELVFSTKASICVDSVTFEMNNSGFKTLVPGHNFFGLKVNDKLYLNISPHQRPGGSQDPIFGRVAFIGKLFVLYVEYEFDGDSYHYVSDGRGNMVRESGMQEIVRSTVIFDIEENRFEFADEKAFAEKLEPDEELLKKYDEDKKRKKRIPFYADQFNQRNPIYLK